MSMIFSTTHPPSFLYQWMMFEESAAPQKPWLLSGCGGSAPERDQAVLAQIDRLLDALLRKVPEVDFAAVFEVADLLEIEARHEGVRRRPLGGVP